MELIQFISETLGVDQQIVQLAALVLGFLFVALIFIILVGLVIYIFRLPKKQTESAETEKKKESDKKPGKDPKQHNKQNKKKDKSAKQRKQEKAPSEDNAPEADEPVPVDSAEPAAATDGNTEGAIQISNEPSNESSAAEKDDGPSDVFLQDVVGSLIKKKGRDEVKKKEKKGFGKGAGRKGSVNTRATSRKLKQQASKLKVPKSSQESIPYLHVYPDTGIIEIEKGKFTKSYLLGDVNYQAAKTEEQAEMFMKYGEFLNSFDPTARIQISINQRNINMEEFEADTMLVLRGDDLDELREEHNTLIRNKILEGRNNLVKDKYITVCIEAVSYDAALTTFARLDTELPSNIKKIGGAVATPITSAKRLEILHDIYNLGDEGLFGNNMTTDKNGNYVFAKDKFSFEIMRRMGLTTKDMIAPESFSFRSDYGMIGDKYFRALFLQKLPSFLADNVLAELSRTDCNMLTSLYFEPIEGEKALKLARYQITGINANMVEKQKQASKAGYSPDLISPELRDSAEEAQALFKDLTGKNQKLFYMTLCIVHFAEDKEQLDSDTKAIQTIGRRLLLGVKKLSWQMENGLATALPLCNNKLQIKRSLTTESAAVFMPFENQELNDRNGGIYYGNNAVSGNLIMHNRRNSKNGNGFILGTPGSGKSMTGKQEMNQVLMSSEDQVVVIDPEGEYSPMAEMLGEDAEVIRIAAGADVHINPFDINMDYDSEDDPISIKSDFIVSLCEAVVGERYGLNPSQRSLIDRCVRTIYKPFLDSRDKNTGVYDYSKIPTLDDFYEAMRDQPGYDAQQLADGLEIYVKGSLNVFAHRTNVQYSKRFVVYDIKDIGSTMKTMGLLVVLDNIWNRIVEGRKEGRNVWFYIDEIYLLFKNQSSAEFLRNLYKRARKYGGLPTGITQNVSDLLENDVARTMISNSEFILMLNQAPLDRAALGQLLNISPTQLSHITNSNPGEGLIYDGVHIVPFVNHLPKNTKQYKAMTTKLSEVKEREIEKQNKQEAS